MSDGTTYRVMIECEATEEVYVNEVDAIAEAAKTEGAEVRMDVVSGTYKSSTIIYPTIGNTYAK